MADLHGGYGGGMAEFDGEDFQEAEVWAMMKGSNSKSKMRKNSSISTSSAWRYAATSRAIPRSASSGGGTPPHQSSVPVSVPDWSKIMKEKPKKNLWDDACDVDDGGKSKFCHGHYDDDDGDDGNMLPPHEYLARRLASTQIASFSMCEGVGRTLKGRDLSKLRNAILTKTGFLE